MNHSTRMAHVADALLYIAKYPYIDEVTTKEKLHIGYGDSVAVALSSNKFLRVPLHAHAQRQLCARLHFPVAYATRLQAMKKDWATALLHENLNNLLTYVPSRGRLLLRARYKPGDVRPTLMGVLSDRYARLDSNVLVPAFLDSAAAKGAAPWSVTSTDLRVTAQALLLDKWTVADHPVSVGVFLNNSEVGAGRLCAHLCIESMGHTMVSTSGVKIVHRGRRIRTDVEDTNNYNELSTEDAINAATTKIQNDVLRHLDPTTLDAIVAELNLAAAKDIDADAAFNVLLRLSLPNDELNTAFAKFKSEDEDLPKNYTWYRLAHTLGWLANNATDPERKISLMELAGHILTE